MTDAAHGDTLVDRARAGDEAAFGELTAPLRGELHAHCYRMLGSVHDADDAVQETLLRAWRAFPGFEGRSSVRTWLHQVATRTCLSMIKQRGRRALPMDLSAAGDPPPSEIAWLEPYVEGADDLVAQQEHVELAFVAALQHLPGNQRAALLLFEVLGFSVAEIAGMLDTTTQSVNSALQRARAAVRSRVSEPGDLPAVRTRDDPALAELVTRYAQALERGDLDALLALLTEDVTWSMPPQTDWYAGVDRVTEFLRGGPLRVSWRHRPALANGQPAVAGYLWDPDVDAYVARVLDVLTLRGDRIAAVTAFLDAEYVVRAGLPGRLPSNTPVTS